MRALCARNTPLILISSPPMLGKGRGAFVARFFSRATPIRESGSPVPQTCLALPHLKAQTDPNKLGTPHCRKNLPP